MNAEIERKMLMGIGCIMIPVPQMMAAKGLEKGVEGANVKSDLLSPEERAIHHFIVRKMAGARDPLTAEQVAGELGLPEDTVEEAIDKLEKLKTFLYRADGKGINWAYPLSLEDTGHRLTDSSGERFFAA